MIAMLELKNRINSLFFAKKNVIMLKNQQDIFIYFKDSNLQFPLNFSISKYLFKNLLANFFHYVSKQLIYK